MAESTSTIRDQSAIDSLNRGPVTSMFIPPSTCTDHLTAQVEDGSTRFYIGHFYQTYVDFNCFPAGSGRTDLLVTKSNWHAYYCKSLNQQLKDT